MVSCFKLVCVGRHLLLPGDRF